jgi:dephospho-CoA kinase
MLRVGLTGELGSGKSTVARLLAGHGAVILSSDEIGRAMMQPGEAVYQAIVDRFGPEIVLPGGQLDRPALARLAFDPANPRVEELNAIVHPAVLAEQERRIAEITVTQPDAIVVIESALIFTTKHAGGDEPWRQRFDCIVLVTAPDELKVERYLHRMAGSQQLSPSGKAQLERDARLRLAAQRIPDQGHRVIQIENTGDLFTLANRTEEVFRDLQAKADHMQHRSLQP